MFSLLFWSFEAKHGRQILFINFKFDVNFNADLDFNFDLIFNISCKIDLNFNV